MGYLVIRQVEPSVYKTDTVDITPLQTTVIEPRLVACDSTIVEFRCKSFSVFYEPDKKGNWNAHYNHITYPH